MSLILEALKKSEDKRRLGAAPDLATPFSAPRPRSWVWPLAALIVVAGVVAWALRPSAPPPTPPVAAVPPKTKAPVAQATPTSGQKTGAPLRSVTGNNDLVQAAPPDNLPKAAPPSNDSPAGQFVFGQPNADAPAGTAVQTRRGTREGVRERRAGIANRNALAASAKTPPAPNAVAAVPPKRNVATPASTPTAPKAPPAPVAPVAAPEPPKTTVAATPLPKQPTAAPPSQPAEVPSRAPKTSATLGLTPPAPATSSAAPGVQSYSELSFSTRKSLPELKLSMHVYAADPSHRFVVLNDSRLTEGEKTNDDIFVREIRPDGVVLEFQNQRFFFPRDGL